VIYLEMLRPGRVSPDIISTVCQHIWPYELAHEATMSLIVDGVTNQTGQVFLIKESNHILGFTGFFDLDPETGVAYLRWTGVLPSYRRTGVFRQAIECLKLHLRGANPKITKLIELVPTAKEAEIAPPFKALGFKADRSVPIPHGEDESWDVIPYVLTF
jgi:hypothetical protein